MNKYSKAHNTALNPATQSADALWVAGLAERYTGERLTHEMGTEGTRRCCS